MPEEKTCRRIRLYTMSAAAAAVRCRPVNAESELVSHVLLAVSKVTDSIVTILFGLIILITVISLVRSGLTAQINAQFQRMFGLSKEIIMVMETITIFVLAIIALPVLKKIMSTAISKVGSQSIMLGNDFHLPNY